MKKFVFAAVASLAATVPAFAEVWEVSEGKQGENRGIWQINVVGTNLTGSATMRDPKSRVITYGLTGAIRDGRLVMQRIAPSQGGACTYVYADPFAKSFNGAAMCGSEQMVWRVVKR